MKKLTTTLLAIALISSIAHSATYYRSTVTNINLSPAWLMYNAGPPTYDPADPLYDPENPDAPRPPNPIGAATSYVAPANVWTPTPPITEPPTPPTPTPNDYPGSLDTIVFWNGPFTSIETTAANRFPVNTSATPIEWGGIQVRSETAAMPQVVFSGAGVAATNLSYLTIGAGGINIYSNVASGNGIGFNNTSANGYLRITLGANQTWSSTLGTLDPDADPVVYGTLANAVISFASTSRSVLDLNGKALEINMARGTHIVGLSGSIIINSGGASGSDIPSITISSGTMQTGHSSNQFGTHGTTITLAGPSATAGAGASPQFSLFSCSLGATYTESANFIISTSATNNETASATYNNRISFTNTTNVTLSGTISGTGNLLILASSGANAGMTITGNNAGFSGTIMATGIGSTSLYTPIRIGHDNALGGSAATLRLHDMATSSIYTCFEASGGDRTLPVNVLMGTNIFGGAHSLTFSGSMSPAGITMDGSTRMRLVNNISGEGKVLEFSGTILDLSTETNNTRSFIFRGSGTTVLSGKIMDAGGLGRRSIVADGLANTGTSLFKTDGGITLILDGWEAKANEYKGQTIICNKGNLYINGNNSQATGAVLFDVTVANGSTTAVDIASPTAGNTLGGIGIVGGVTTFKAENFLRPGTPALAGNLTFNNTLNLVANSTLLFRAGSLVTNVGILNLAANWKLTLEGDLADWFIGGETLLFDYNQTLGLANTISLLATIDAFGIPDLSLRNDTTDGKIYLVGLSVVPEPSAIALLGLSALAVVLLRRRK